MKKIITLALALVMVLSFAVAASAQTYEDMSTVTINKSYTNPNAGSSPAETFTFTHEKVGVTNAGEVNGKVVTVDTMPALVSVSAVKFAEGGAGSVKGAEVTLPEYEAVGIYEYKIKEVAGNTAGVTYHNADIKLVITVIEQDGKVRVAAVHTETSGAKNDTIVNVYESGTLAVSKEVTGNLGDREKEFDVTVTFTAPAGEQIKSKITYVEDGKTIEVANNKATIQLKHGETIKFSNIPEGVTYTVEEADYTTEGYKAAVYAFSDNAKLVNGGVTGANDDTVTITNEKDVPVDTGIVMDSIPFVMMLVIAAVGLVAFTAKKRVQE